MGFLDVIIKAFEKEISHVSNANLVLKDSKKIGLDKNKTLIIQTLCVNFEIVNSTKEQEFDYEIYMSEENSLSDISVVIVNNTENKEITITLKKARNIGNCRVVFHLPLDFDVKVFNGNGNVKIKDSKFHTLGISSSNGNVKIGNSKIDNINIELGNGNIKIEEGITFMDAKLATQNGNIKVVLGGISCKISTNSAHGNIKLSNVISDLSSENKLTCTTINGNIKISGI
ncbi:MAG: DUF4097 family beta strand repeat protein [Bacteroidales bacterium]|nr:DUF4097 family beta strand repeat protein [Candidatus Physcocola equi]